MATVYDKWQRETGVKVIAISIDDNRNYTKVPSFVRSKGWPFDFYQDKNQDIKRAMGISVCPLTVIISATGEISWRKTGYMQGDEEIVYETLQKVIEGKKIAE